MNAELFSRVYAFLGDQTISPTGYEWEHGRLRRLTTDLLAAMTPDDRCPVCWTGADVLDGGR